MQIFRGLVLSLFFLIMGIYMVYQSLNHYRIDGRDWLKVYGVIVSVKSVGINDKTADLSIQYQYKAENKIYLSKSVVRGHSAADNEHHTKYLEGKKVKVFYDPGQPNRAVLEPGMRKIDMVEGIVSISIGLLILFFTLHYARIHQDRIFAP